MRRCLMLYVVGGMVVLVLGVDLRIALALLVPRYRLDLSGGCSAMIHYDGVVTISADGCSDN